MLVLRVMRLDKAAGWSESCGARRKDGQDGAMIEDVSTLAELREHLAEAEGRAVVNGRPFVDGAEVDCYPCRRGIAETDEVVWDKRMQGLLWDVTVSHVGC